MLESIKILGVDASMRGTGVALFEGELMLIHKLIPTKPKHSKFEALEHDAISMNEVVSEVYDIIQKHKPDVIAIEFPCFTQSAKSAILIGMVWGCFANLLLHPDCYAIEPEALKKWSGSKRGDGKTKVGDKVLLRVDVETENDNVLDAIGICLMCKDQIKEYANAII